MRKWKAWESNVIPNMKPGILENHPYREVFEENDVFVKPRIRKTITADAGGAEKDASWTLQEKGKKYLEGTVKGNSSEKRFKDGMVTTTVNTTALRTEMPSVNLKAWAEPWRN